MPIEQTRRGRTIYRDLFLACELTNCFAGVEQRFSEALCDTATAEEANMDVAPLLSLQVHRCNADGSSATTSVGNLLLEDPQKYFATYKAKNVNCVFRSSGRMWIQNVLVSTIPSWYEASFFFPLLSLLPDPCISCRSLS